MNFSTTLKTNLVIVEECRCEIRTVHLLATLIGRLEDLWYLLIYEFFIMKKGQDEIMRRRVVGHRRREEGATASVRVK